jgi:hypothetical protein
VEELRKRDAKFSQTAAKVQTLLLKATKGDLSSVKSKLSDIPKEALPSLTGLDIPEGEIKESDLRSEPFDYQTATLSTFELACVHGHSKLLTYLVEEANLRPKELPQDTMIEAIDFIAAPVYKKDKAVI